jgi:hypothetical protein
MWGDRKPDPERIVDYPTRLSDAGSIWPIQGKSWLVEACGGFEKISVPSSTDVHFRLMVSRK